MSQHRPATRTYVRPMTGWWLRNPRFRRYMLREVGKLALLAVIALFLFHGCHRLLHSLHDLGVRTGTGARWNFHGFAALGSVAAGVLLLVVL